MLDFSHVNLWAVIVAALVDMGIGFVWYSKAAFGNLWFKLNGVKMKEGEQPNPAIYLVNLVVYLILAFALAQAVFFFGVTGALSGAALAVFVFVGFIVPVSVVENLFAQRSWKLFAINYGYPLVAIMVMTAILAVWK